MICKICNSPTKILFVKTVLHKHKSCYHQCTNCDFVQTDEPFWLNEAYEKVITSLDIGLVQRNINFSNDLKNIINVCFPSTKKCLDYAGGYGFFVRLMRDKGYDFYRYDAYCQNLFSEYFDVKKIEVEKFDLITAFEVFEHLNHPLEEVEKIIQQSDILIFSTELVPNNKNDIENWWYIAEETGQHISFYSEKSLKIIAQKFNKNYYNRKDRLHVFTTKKLNWFESNFINQKYKLLNQILQASSRLKIKRKPLIQDDFNHVRKQLNSNPTS